METAKPHRRYNPLTGEWVLVSPHRTQRPWQGQTEDLPATELPQYDPECYLCPGNKRAGGKINPDYRDTFVFTNDFQALLPDIKPGSIGTHELLQAENIAGTCRVICFSPRHDLTLASMELQDICKVIDLWAEQITELSQDYAWVQVFENRGAMMGCSNPHPHCQVWASSSIPNEIAKEEIQQKEYWQQHTKVLLQEYLELEIAEKDRIVLENEHWLIVIPFWAVWPFETMMLPKRHVQYFPDLTAAERASLADIMQKLLIKYNKLFNVSFPYSMGWHSAPYTKGDHEYWQLHAHYYPPLLRSATVKKFMVGYEMLAEPQRDVTPELAAAKLREI